MAALIFNYFSNPFHLIKFDLNRKGFDFKNERFKPSSTIFISRFEFEFQISKMTNFPTV
jgi:hypothetical protein